MAGNETLSDDLGSLAEVVGWYAAELGESGDTTGEGEIRSDLASLQAIVGYAERGRVPVDPQLVLSLATIVGAAEKWKANLPRESEQGHQILSSIEHVLSRLVADQAVGLGRDHD